MKNNRIVENAMYQLGIGKRKCFDAGSRKKRKVGN